MTTKTSLNSSIRQFIVCGYFFPRLLAPPVRATFRPPRPLACNVLPFTRGRTLEAVFIGDRLVSED